MLLALAAGFVSPAAGIATAATATPSQPSPTRLLGCHGTRAEIRPAYILVACGDANFYVNHVEWSRWTATTSLGAAIAHQNDCRPFCAAGHFRAYRVTIRLFRPEICRSGRLFTRFTYVFVNATPAGISRKHTIRAPFYAHSGCA